LGVHLNACQFQQLCEGSRTVFLGFDGDANASRQQASQGLAHRLRAQGIVTREAVTEVAEAVQTTFGLHRDLQETLRHNIEQVGPGLEITDEGKEQKVDSGFIDITAEDSSGSAVVIELKAGTPDRGTIGQILGYIGEE